MVRHLARTSPSKEEDKAKMIAVVSNVLVVLAVLVHARETTRFRELLCKLLSERREEKLRAVYIPGEIKKERHEERLDDVV